MKEHNYRLLWFISYLVFTTGILIVLSATIIAGPRVMFSYDGPSQDYYNFMRHSYAVEQSRQQKEKAVTNMGIVVLGMGAALMVGHCFINWQGGSSVPVCCE